MLRGVLCTALWSQAATASLQSRRRTGRTTSYRGLALCSITLDHLLSVFSETVSRLPVPRTVPLSAKIVANRDDFRSAEIIPPEREL